MSVCSILINYLGAPNDAGVVQSLLADAPHVPFVEVYNSEDESEWALLESLLRPWVLRIRSPGNIGPVGIHCVTHLRFFARRTLLDLLDRSGLVVESIETTTVASPLNWKDHWLATPDLKTQGSELDAYAFVFCASTRPAGQAT